MRWMEIALSQEGVAEVAGPGASKSVLNYFAENNRRDITSDEVPWCAAFYFWCLWKAGIDVDVIPKADRLLARSATKLGTRISAPRVGCGVVMERPGGHHVGFVTGWTETTIWIFGGNQANSVCEREFKRTDDMIFMWPVPPATASEVAAEGSRTVNTAGRQRVDASKATGAEVSTHVIPDAPPFPAPDALAAKGTALQGWVSTAESFFTFAWGKWPWIAGAITVYYLARMAWDAGLIRFWRTEDRNTGKVTGAGAEPAPPPSEPEEVSLV
jgi:uncharacterized protein (TIGR02594 family)